MARPKGSKNKTEETPKESAPKGFGFKNNKQAEVAKECDFRVNYNPETKILLTETTGQASYRAFLNGKSVIEHGEKDNFYGTDADRNDWTGGTLEDIHQAEKGHFDINPFLKQKEQLQKNFGSLDFLEAEIARKRQRFMSEHDGELDFDRLYEREPFYHTRVTNNGVTRVMDINVDFTFSSGVNAKEIAEYGTMAWAVMDILEKSGIRCNVFINTDCSGQSQGAESVNKYLTKIKIKSTEEYMDTVDLARHFTPNYYRRVIFGTWCLAQEAVGRDMSYGLGRVNHWDRSTTSSKGVINFAIAQMRDFKLDSQKLVEYIRGAL